jgi:tRNA (guanine-N7-)-methyltransferase
MAAGEIADTVPKKKLIHFQENLTFPHLFQLRYSELQAGFRYRGSWNENFFGNHNPLILELGCGKGEYTVGMARAYPGINFVGIDIKGARLWTGCKTAEVENLRNVAFIRTRVDHVEKFFAGSEVSEIWITFPDPQPGKERKRLTSPNFLERYSRLLPGNGIIHLKTDDRGFYEYSLRVIREGNHRLLWSSDDLYNSGSMGDAVKFQTHYEKIWLGIGKKIFYLKFSLN